MVGLFVRLKLSLVRNGLRGGWPRKAGLIVGVALAVPTALAGFVILASARLDRTTGRDIAVVGFTALFIGWISLPVLGFGSDETLDPSRLALLPLTARQMMAGLLAASAVGVAPIATLLALSGAVVGYSSSAASVALVAVAVVLELGLCLAGGRAVVTSLSRMLRSRRGRDISILIVALVAMLPQLFRLVLPTGGAHDVDLTPLVSALRWLPPGLAGQAMVDAGRGHLASAAGELVLAAGCLLALLVWWGSSLRVALTTAEATTRSRSASRSAESSSSSTRTRRERPGRPLYPRFVPFLPVDRSGAVAARELRTIIRDPRRRVQVLYGVLTPVFALAPLLAEGGLSRPTSVLAALSIPFFLGTFSALNQFGVDGAAYWTNVAAGNDPRADLVGKNIAAAVVTLPFLTVAAVALAVVTGGWAYLVPTLAIGVAVLGAGLGVGNMVSVLAPQPLAESSTNMWAQRSGQGCSTGLVNFGSVFIEMVVLLPVAAAAFAVTAWPLAAVIAAPASLAYGGLIWRIGLRRASDRVWWRLPELLDSISPRNAA